MTNGAGVSVSRKQIVLGAANRDGGAHVDEKLHAFYEDLIGGEWALGITGNFTYDAGICCGTDVTVVAHWLASHAGIYTQAALALVFQLVGVGLVIDDVRSARRRLVGLYQRFADIDTETKIAIKRANADVFDENDNVKAGTDFATAFGTPFMTLQIMTGGLHAKADALARQHDEYSERPWATWIGPATLFLGIVFSFTATISAI